MWLIVGPIKIPTEKKKGGGSKQLLRTKQHHMAFSTEHLEGVVLFELRSCWNVTVTPQSPHVPNGFIFTSGEGCDYPRLLFP